VILPDFNADLGPELEAAMTEHRTEVETIAAADEPPTFANTIEALERSGTRLHRVARLLDDTALARSTEAIRALEAEMLPRLAAHRDAVGMDPRLFARIADLAARRETLGLDAVQQRVLDRYHRDVVRAGATLGPGDQTRLRAINERLSALTAQYRRNLHEETAALAVRVGTAAELDGLPEGRVEAAARAAGGDGYVLTLSLPSAQPAHEYLHDRALRERLWHASVARGRRGGAHDNRATVAEIAARRAERAGLLGFGSHAEYAIADETAGTVAAVRAFLEEIAAAAGTAARAEAERLEEGLRADGHTGPLEPWDWPYYAARERRRRHAVDEAGLVEFFELDRVVSDGAFAVAGTLYGLSFTERHDVARPDPGVRVWSVDDADGGSRGLLYLDPFARSGKRGGAWMDSYADPAPLLGRLPLVVLHLNVTPPAPGAPILLTPLDVRILFHEFGHALHMLLSDVWFPRVAGINVASDVVEFPSKFHESLAVRPDVLSGYARHHRTGAPLPEAAVAALTASVRDGAAYGTAQGVANALLDQAWHGLAPGDTVAPEAVDAFEADVLARHGLDLRAAGFNYRSSFFVHSFDGFYAGTHYSYLWSGALEAVALGWLDEEGGLSRRAGSRLRDELLSQGAAVDPLAAFRAITGRDPSVQPLLQRRGLA
jgi:peptidyl-dipeptidase Dcp